MILSGLKLIGINPLQFINFFKGLPFYFKNYLELKRHNNKKMFPFGKFYPFFNDRFEKSGHIGVYTLQDLFVARQIYKNNPSCHLDIGSRIDGLVSHLAVFREIEVMDIRPMTSWDKNIYFKQADLMLLPEELVDKYVSISSLHAIEHFGLGRYSDPIDANGHIKAINNIHQLLRNGGKFYFSVPIGPQRIEFNAHRVFAISYLIELFQEKFVIENFSYINDNGSLYENVFLDENHIQNNCFCKFGCGIFELKCIK